MTASTHSAGGGTLTGRLVYARRHWPILRPSSLIRELGLTDWMPAGFLAAARTRSFDLMFFWAYMTFPAMVVAYGVDLDRPVGLQILGAMVDAP